MNENVGAVLYRKSNKPGTLYAEFCHTDDGAGHGIATASEEPYQDFEGKYRIQYFDQNGDLQAERDLEIRKEGEQYHLTWFNNKVISGKGIGFETDEGLVAGYVDV